MTRTRRINVTALLSLTVFAAFMMVGCGAPTPSVATQGVNQTTQSSAPPKKTTSSSTQSVKFFKDTFANGAMLTLKPDPFVQQHMPNFPSPKAIVNVYLPVYPGAKLATPNTSIGDMGTPLDADLVDGTVYYKSSASEKQILSWYATQFQKLGYKQNGQGRANDHGKTVTTYVDFTKSGAPAGTPTTTPDIDLGFLSHQEDGKTIFKLKASFIVVPPRPKGTYLPTDITKIVLTHAKKSKTITDSTWIAKVVKLFNSLQVSTPGITSGGTNSTGTDETIHATFYAKDGSSIKITFNLMFDTAKVDQSKTTLHNNIILEKDLESELGM